MKQEYLRKIPAVTRLLQRAELALVLQQYPQNLVVDIVNQVLTVKRECILQGTFDPANMDLSEAGLAAEVRDRVLQYMSPRLKRVINATGTILHTNLGRAVLSEEAAGALEHIARGYCNLEYDLAHGERGSRYALVNDWLCRLTGAEDALVVNNNAAAVLLVLSTLAQGKEVILSRGEIVEIGGSFRMHEVMKASGCTLIEVGSTNKTHLLDYAEAITSETGLLTRVHTSNYQVVGFHESVSNSELVQLGHEHNIPVYEDLGSGVLINLEEYGITHEPTVQEAVRAGVDVISFSGDKLLGGPQAGIIVGKKEFIQRLKRNHLLRALRVDKFTMAALEVTLKHYLCEEEAMEKIPTLHMLKQTQDEVRSRAEDLQNRLQGVLTDAAIRTMAGMSMVGGGSLPLEQIPTWLLAVKFARLSTADAANKLRDREISIICRIQDDELFFDLRTLLPGEEEEILQALDALNH